MTIQELRDFFIKSDYSEETKTIIAGMLNNKTEITPGLIFELKDVLQKELDFDFKELGIEVENNEEAKQAKKEYDETLDSIEKDLGEDMVFVEKELKELEETRKIVSKISDEIEADKIRQSI